jgi:DNA mismatch repair protein MutS
VVESHPRVSVIFKDVERAKAAELALEPPCWRDLHLDQLAGTMLAGRERYGLLPLLFAPLGDVDAVRWRQEVLADLDRSEVMTVIRAFTAAMATMRRDLEHAAHLFEPLQRQWWRLEAARVYCELVRALAAGLASAVPSSRGLRVLLEDVAAYVRGETFTSLAAEEAAVRAALGKVCYCLLIGDDRVVVSAWRGEPDYRAEVSDAFARFRLADVRAHQSGLSSRLEMDHVEAAIARHVAQLFPEAFGALALFAESRRDFPDPTLVAVERELQLLLAACELTERASLPWCRPEVTEETSVFEAEACFDAALALVRNGEGRRIVANDVCVRAPERFVVITGPNQGGKTTFARSLGQLAHFASLGLPVPAQRARLPLFDAVFTHFGTEEDAGAAGSGKLRDDVVRLAELARSASPRSFVVLNELFSSTALADAVELGRRVVDALAGAGVLGVYVTFLDELATLEQVVSMVSEVDPHDPAVRTYRVSRRPADGRAYAMVLAARHGLDRERLLARLAAESGGASR